MGFDSSDKKIHELFNNKMFIIAANQRKYVWTQNNWREMFEDINLVYEEKTDKHFIGSIVLKREKISDGIKNHFSIIDGQQRITTITILLCVIAYLFAEFEEQRRFEGLKNYLFVTDNRNNSFPIVSDDANKYISKLVQVLYQEARTHFDSHFPLLSTTDLIKEAGCTKPIKQCLMFFYSELNNYIDNELKLNKTNECLNIQDMSPNEINEFKTNVLAKYYKLSHQAQLA